MITHVMHACYVSRHPESEILLTIKQDNEFYHLTVDRNEQFVGLPIQDSNPLEYESVEIELPNPNPVVDNPPKILRYIDPSFHSGYQQVHYGTLSIRLHDQVPMHRGVVPEINKFANFSVDVLTGQQVFDDRIIIEKIDYVRDAAGYAQIQTKRVGYICENLDEQGNEVIIWKNPPRVKYYTTETSIAEQDRRRANVINFLKAQLVIGRTILGDTNAVGTVQTLFGPFGELILAYRETGHNGFILNALLTDTNLTWLNDPIPQFPDFPTTRDFIIDELTWP